MDVRSERGSGSASSTTLSSTPNVKIRLAGYYYGIRYLQTLGAVRKDAKSSSFPVEISEYAVNSATGYEQVKALRQTALRRFQLPSDAPLRQSARS